MICFVRNSPDPPVLPCAIPNLSVIISFIRFDDYIKKTCSYSAPRLRILSIRQAYFFAYSVSHGVAAIKNRAGGGIRLLLDGRASRPGRSDA